ncbi:MAG: hypothetical protein ACRDG7_19425, partial [Candidatus Limnocylindria bacterium]
MRVSLAVAVFLVLSLFIGVAHAKGGTFEEDETVGGTASSGAVPATEASETEEGTPPPDSGPAEQPAPETPDPAETPSPDPAPGDEAPPPEETPVEPGPVVPAP